MGVPPPIRIWLYRKNPPDWGNPFTKKVSGSSRSHTSQRDHTFAPDYEAYAQSQIERGFDIVAIAHLHIPVSKTLGTGLYINTGDFISHFSYVRMDAVAATLRYLK
jgi:predicted phosphodiesterase